MKADASLMVRVAEKRTEAVDISSFTLVDVVGGPLPAFSAGSHIDVSLPGGLVRQYSLCNDPAHDGRYVISVLRAPDSRGGSRAMHMLNEGDVLSVSPPRNHFELARGSAHSLLLAGGIGITPLLCMAERLALNGDSLELHYCTRSRERTAFLDRIRTSSFAARSHFHFDDGEPDQRLDVETVLARPASDVHLYVCGPQGFMDAALGAARRLGWLEEQLHFEYFGAALQKPVDGDSFEVQLVSSGRIVVVRPNQSVVDALGDAGIVIPSSCVQGVCGTCLTRVLSGEPDHQDLYLSVEEQAANDQFLPCCSRAKSQRLVLDL